MNQLHQLAAANRMRQARAHALKASSMTHAPNVAVLRASKLTGKELLTILTPIRHSVEQARKGKLTEGQWVAPCTAMNLGRAIEDQGVVRGLSDALDAIKASLQAIGDRATDTGNQPWSPPTLHADELAHLRELATLHAFQLKHLSYGEYREAFRIAVARVASSGGQVDKGDPFTFAEIPADAMTGVD